MSSRLIELFDDKTMVEKIQRKLPSLFAIADKECQRAGKVGMEVGSTRERIIIALLMHKFGEKNVLTDIPITESEVDVRLFGYPISIKSITGNGGIKAVWTVDAKSSMAFLKNYSPTCDMLLVKIQKKSNNISDRSKAGGLFWISLELQKKVLNKIGRENYLKLPKEDTNPRGVEFNNNAMTILLQDNETRFIPIIWKYMDIPYDPYKRWVEYWEE